MSSRKVNYYFGLLAAIITIFVFFTGINNIFQFCSDKVQQLSETEKSPKETAQNYDIRDSIYVRQTFPIFGEYELICLHKGREYKLFKNQNGIGKFVTSPLRKRVAIMQSFDLHIMNIDGSKHQIYKTGYLSNLSNISFLTDSILRVSYSNSEFVKDTLYFDGPEIGGRGFFDFFLDATNYIIKTAKVNK
jgi:hypothetical protein